jgi:prepilin-type N-terminal cleavage/methylation domain-containing protein
MEKMDLKNQKGFTLVEVLIVAFMLSLVMAAVYSLYQTHLRSAYVSDEVVEVQQNLRVGIESMTRDIRMAGFLVPRTMPPTLTPIDNASTATDLTLNTGSLVSTSAFATIAQDRTGLGLFSVETGTSVDAFSDLDVVTIVRPYLTSVNYIPGAAGNTFRVSAGGRSDVPPYSITLEVNPPSIDTGAQYRTGDLIVRSGGQYPNKIRYCLGPVPGCGNGVTTCPTGQTCLMRIVNGGVAPNGSTDPIAQNIAPNGLQLTYLLDDLTEVPVPADFSKVRAVRVVLNGRTVTTTKLSANQAKPRQTVSIIQIRNKF